MAKEGMGITLDEQIKEIRRELALRQRVYPQWVAAGRMKQDQMDSQMERLQAAHNTLVRLRDLGERSVFFGAALEALERRENDPDS